MWSSITFIAFSVEAQIRIGVVDDHVQSFSTLKEIDSGVLGTTISKAHELARSPRLHLSRNMVQICIAVWSSEAMIAEVVRLMKLGP